MKSTKKIFIGLAAVAAVGVSALCLSNSKCPEILSENVSALSFAYCAYEPNAVCVTRWLDGDVWIMEDFVKVGLDEVDEFLLETYLQNKALSGN